MQRSKPAIHRSENDLNMRASSVCALQLTYIAAPVRPGLLTGHAVHVVHGTQANEQGKGVRKRRNALGRAVRHVGRGLAFAADQFDVSAFFEQVFDQLVITTRCSMM